MKSWMLPTLRRDNMYEKIDAYIDRLIRESTPERTVWNIETIRQG